MLRRKVVVLKKAFCPFRLLSLITVFFQGAMFLYFTKVVVVIHSSMDTVFFRRALATMNCVYTTYLTDISIYAILLFQGALEAIYLSGTVIISGTHLP